MVSNKTYPAIATSTVAGIAPEYRSELIEATNEWASDNKSEYWEEGYFDLERFENDYVTIGSAEGERMENDKNGSN